MDDFLQAVLSRLESGQSRRNRLAEIEQRTLDRTLHERQLQAQQDHQTFLEKLQRDQFAEQQKERAFNEQQARQANAFKAAQEVGNGNFMLGEYNLPPQTFTTPSLLPNGETAPAKTPFVPPTLVTPGPGMDVPGFGLIVPTDPSVKEARAARIKQAEYAAQAEGEASLTEKRRTAAMNALDAFMKDDPTLFKNNPDLYTDAKMSLILGRELRTDTMQNVLGSALKAIMDPLTPPDKLQRAKEVWITYNTARIPQVSPGIADNRYASTLASQALNMAKEQLTPQYQGKEIPTEVLHQTAGNILASMGTSDPRVQSVLPEAIAHLATMNQFKQKPPNWLQLLLGQGRTSPFPGAPVGPAAPLPDSTPTFYPKK